MDVESSPGIITDHAFVQEEERLGVKEPWYGLCGYLKPIEGSPKCGLSEAAHTTTYRKKQTDGD